MLESLKHNKQNFIILSVILTIIAIPVAYSVTEPNIIIDMVLDQTTNPISILNSTGFETFGIFSDGSVNGKHFLVYRSDYATEHTTPEGVEDSDPIFLAKWEIDRGVITEPQDFIMQDGMISALIKRDTGGGSVQIGWYISVDGSTWLTLNQNSGAGASYAEVTTEGGGDFSTNTTIFLGVGISSSNASTSGSLKSIVATIDVVLLPDMTLTRII